MYNIRNKFLAHSKVGKLRWEDQGRDRSEVLIDSQAVAGMLIKTGLRL